MTKILLVDDEELVREELGGLLDDEGYHVITGSDGEEGLKLFEQEKPDMVITDVRMPRVDGLSLVATIRQQSPKTPVTVITGHGNEAMAIEALRAGVTDFIKKPVKLEDLLSALGRMEDSLGLIRRAPEEVPDSAKLVEERSVYELDNNRSVIPTFVDAILNKCASKLTPEAKTELSLALRELILNAVEHGNLGLSFEEKADALEKGSLETILETKLKDQKLAKRRVKIDICSCEDGVSFEITDQGKGFDWRALPDPMDPMNLLAEHGRGVLLAQMSVDELSYNEKGNQVKAIKYFGKSDDAQNALLKK